MFFFFNDTATTEIYTLSLHDALPIFGVTPGRGLTFTNPALHNRLQVPIAVIDKPREQVRDVMWLQLAGAAGHVAVRSEEHTSELQSRQYLVCRLLLEKNKHTSAFK